MTIVRSAAYKNQQWYWRNHDAVDMTGGAPLGHSGIGGSINEQGGQRSA
jgi:hypothetical protein